MQQEPVIIVDDKGNEHEFPVGFDPKRAAGIVRQQTAPKGGERTRVDTNVVGFDQDKWSNMASKLPEKVMGVPVRYPVAFAGSLAGTAMETLSAPESLATAGMGRVPDALPPGRPNPQLAGIRAAAGVAAKEGVKDIPVVRRWVRRADKIGDAYKEAANAARKTPDIVPPGSVRIPPAPPKPTIDVEPRGLPSGQYSGPQTLREAQPLPSGPSVPRQIGPAQSIQLGRGEGPATAPMRPTPSTTPGAQARPTTGSASAATATSARLPQSPPATSVPPAGESTPLATAKSSVRAPRVKTPSTKGAKLAESSTGADNLDTLQRAMHGEDVPTVPNGGARRVIPPEATNAHGGLNPGWRFAEVGAANPDVLRRSFTTPDQLAKYVPTKGWKLVLRAPDGRTFPVPSGE